jgi:hypothetical protein
MSIATSNSAEQNTFRLLWIPALISLGVTFLWLAFFPQLVAWVSYTVVLGVLAASLAIPVLCVFSREAGRE